MKPLVYVIAVLLFSAFCSCRPSKNLTTDNSDNYKEILEELCTSVSKIDRKIDTQSKTTSEKMSNLKVENKTVYLSAPDSTGKQYPTMESTTTATKVDEQKEENVEHTTEILSYIDERIDSLNRKIDLMSENKVVEKQLTAWQQFKLDVGGFAISALVLIIVVLIIKKRR